MARHLNGEMGAGAKAVETETAARLDLAQAQGTVANDARTEQGRCFGISERAGQGECVAFVDDEIFSIAAVCIEAGKARLLAEIFQPLPAEIALRRRPN